jgi:putative effector of murein hydrolase/putative effector of murein hydrolase LrgA (UPF0299 family)
VRAAGAELFLATRTVYGFSHLRQRTSFRAAWSWDLWRRIIATSLGVAWLGALDALCLGLLSKFEIRFPSFVLTMVLLFLALLASRMVSEKWVDRFSYLMEPARSFLSRWMALFFVPPLVLLPKSQPPSPRDLMLAAFVGCLGFLASFWLGGQIAKWMAPPPEEPASEGGHASPPGPTSSKLLLAWALGSISLGLVWFATEADFAKLLFGLALSVFCFLGTEWLREVLGRTNLRIFAMFCQPVLVGAAAIALGWSLTGADLSDYLRPLSDKTTPGALLVLLLRPAVVSLAFALDRERFRLRVNVRPLLAATAGSALLSLVATAGLAGLLDIEEDLGRALVPRSVTTPVALSMADLLDGNPGTTAVVVILTGVLGAIFSEPLARLFGFRSSFVVGVATGISSHGIGTAGLIRHNPSAAAFSGIAFALMAVFSVTLVSWPWLRDLVLGLL